jgi:hypothetical protein
VEGKYAAQRRHWTARQPSLHQLTNPAEKAPRYRSIIKNIEELAWLQLLCRSTRSCAQVAYLTGGIGMNLAPGTTILMVWSSHTNAESVITDPTW